MRIALFTDTYLPQVNGVSGTLSRLVRHAAERGHEVALVTPRVSPQGADEAVFHHQLAGIPIPIYPQLRIGRLMDGRGRAMLRAFDPDLVHVATESTVGWSGARWALREGIPLATSFHTNFPDYLGGYGLGFAKGAVWRYLRGFHGQSARTFCPSPTTARELARKGFHDRVSIWPRGVNSILFNPERRQDSVRQRLAPGADIILFYAGRLASEKKLDVLLSAYGIVRKRSRRKVALVIAGEGPQGRRLRRVAPPGVHFTGFLHGEELADAYAAADIFAFPSDTETFGNVVLEAMASGLPVVAADRGGVRDLVEPGRTGLLVPPDFPASFAEALLRLIDADRWRQECGRAARLSAEGRSWPMILDTLLEEYEYLASKKEVTA